MSHYKHLSIEERESILILQTQGHGVREIARQLGRSGSTISRELGRNGGRRKGYSAVKAQAGYKNRRKRSRRHKLVEQAGMKEKLRQLLLEQQWSPEQISNRLRQEGSPYQISTTSIYRAINARELDPPGLHENNRGIRRKLRHRGKPRRRKGAVDPRGKIPITNRIGDRPQQAQERKVIGHWEADTLLGKLGGACLVTVTDRCSRYLLAGKLEKKQSALLAQEMIALFSQLPKDYIRSITPDRGKEFHHHERVSDALGGVPFYFADPHAPWQRGTNENTNGLLREYFPKSFDFDSCSHEHIAACLDKLNKRPRKCLNWASPFEFFFHHVLHLT